MALTKEKGSVFLFALMLVLVGCSTNGSTLAEEKDEPARFPVEISQIEMGTLTSQLSLSGNVMASKQLPVLPMVAGEVKAVHVKNGDIVERGDIIIEIDVSDIELSLSQARAGLEAAEVNLNGTKAMREQSIRQAQMQLNQAKELYKMLNEAEDIDIELENVPEEFHDIFHRLIQSNMPTEADKKQAKTAVEQAEMALAQAKRTEQVDAASASVKQANLSVEMAEKQKKHAVVRAPIGGQISNFNTSVGAMVSPQAPLLQVVQMDEPVVHLNVNESMLANLEVDQEVGVYIRSNNEEYDGRITYIGIMPTEQSRAYPVEIAILNPEEKLRVGMLAEVLITPSMVNQEVLVHVDAVMYEKDESIVYVTADGESVERRVITIGNETSEWISVESGLEVGEFVVIRGIHQLYDEALINIRNDIGQSFGEKIEEPLESEDKESSSENEV
ncbi:hypothetical protein BKP45_01460 [Anaerobacillus alkalidiazotrophicus]|uniref:Uncharacterized protein n=1 Tax=Anaerobacillus alkalidiazotrophicus TaxID=472963 RepID=A0A1S2MCS0_9BACI|nr:efflux RND transporter periplasmic adaptor subunit [Anaerobacillus alkalidiazotrophicus]OIJ21465.1 hypothetical protein BKP45_01460 [Anaerobacillus alkalidiazotrophicus]